MLIVERSDQQRPKPQLHKRFTTELSNNVYRSNQSIEQRRSSLPVGFRYHSISALERTKSKANSAIGLRSSFYSFRKPGLAASASLSLWRTKAAEPVHCSLPSLDEHLPKKFALRSDSQTIIVSEKKKFVKGRSK